MVRIAHVVQGQVQGVGFRPFVWRLARDCGLTGAVGNTSAGVRITVQGAEGALRRFAERLAKELPPLAKITHWQQENVPVVEGEAEFTILPSESHGGQNVLVSADVAICADCLADIRRLGDRRFGYAFTNCTNCGPRFSITGSIPYDRPVTTMACFPMCDACAAEYANPGDRRFHAQPIACPHCGPKIWFVSREEARAGHTLPTEENVTHALKLSASLIRAGGILAMRGLGGFQLICSATNPAAVAALRQRKHRPHKALALMAPTLESVDRWCQLTPAHRQLLSGPQKPIVLCPAREPDGPLAAAVAPDSTHLGFMLPYTPLHAILMDALTEAGDPPCLVVTSANVAGEPITLGNREALRRLDHLADGWLLHDRDILCRIDDSVVAVGEDERPLFLRRARGYVPEPTPLKSTGPTVLGVGAELKATFCLTRGANAFLGQHIGDMKTPACLEFYEEALGHLRRLLEAEPELVVHDGHPDFLSTALAKTWAKDRRIPVVGLQHHAAHAVACLAEHGHQGGALALCLDGSGLGSDGVIWGGELLAVDMAATCWRRLGSLSAFPLPGGDMAVQEPWRIATALHWQQGDGQWHPTDRDKKLKAMLTAQCNCPMTTSCGRLFDAVAAELGLCSVITYEAQAALRLEKAATLWRMAHSHEPILPLPSPVHISAEGFLLLNSEELFGGAVQWRRRGVEAGAIAFSFHHWLAQGFAAMAATAGKRCGYRHIALSGGVLHNNILRTALAGELTARGLIPLPHSNPGDGGLALGQAVWGVQLLRGRPAESMGDMKRGEEPARLSPEPVPDKQAESEND